ncbi:hypothetical protein Q3G72_013579 [Acer saccharum]|nr:hypothetical protein Q3G72_013579 [Acer saccharum]
MDMKVVDTKDLEDMKVVEAKDLEDSSFVVEVLNEEEIGNMSNGEEKVKLEICGQEYREPDSMFIFENHLKDHQSILLRDTHNVTTISENAYLGVQAIDGNASIEKEKGLTDHNSTVSSLLFAAAAHIVTDHSSTIASFLLAPPQLHSLSVRHLLTFAATTLSPIRGINKSPVLIGNIDDDNEPYLGAFLEARC